MTELKRTRDLMAAGMSRFEIAQAAREGTLQRVRRGVYASPSERTAEADHLLRVQATMPLLHPESVLSHVSAAVVHGLPVPWGELGTVHVTRPGNAHGRRDSGLFFHAGDLDGDEWVEVGDLRVTGLARTVADLARTMPYEWGVIVADNALHRGVLQRDALLEQIRRRPRLRGRSRARGVALFADELSESPCESLSRVQFDRLGIPKPVLQFEIRHGDRLIARTDFAWPDLGVVGEADGKAKYGELLKPGQTAADAVMAEKQREENIRAQGYRTVRWGWEEASHPDKLERRVRSALRPIVRRSA